MGLEVLEETNLVLEADATNIAMECGGVICLAVILQFIQGSKHFLLETNSKCYHKRVG